MGEGVLRDSAELQEISIHGLDRIVIYKCNWLKFHRASAEFEWGREFQEFPRNSKSWFGQNCALPKQLAKIPRDSAECEGGRRELGKKGGEGYVPNGANAPPYITNHHMPLFTKGVVNQYVSAFKKM